MISLLQRWYQRHFSQPGTIEFALVLLSAFLIVYYLMWLVGPIVVALCLAFCLDWPTVNLCNKFRLSRHVAAIIVMFLFCSTVVFITVLIVPNVIKQGAEFYNSIVSFSLESPNHAKGPSPSVPATGALSSDAASTQLSTAPTSATAPRATSPMAHVVPAAAAPMASAAQAVAAHPARSTPAEPTNLATPTSAPEAALQTASLPALPLPATPDANAAGANSDNANATGASSDNGTTLPETPYLPMAQVPTDLSQTQERLELIASGGPRFIANLEVNREPSEFTLTVRDFDLRFARELHDIVVRLPEPLPSMVDMATLERMVRGMRVGATNQIANLMRTQLMPSVVNAFTWLVYLIVVPIFTFLMLYNKHELQQRARQFLLPNNQELMRKFWPSMHQQIAGYIRGKILHIIIISIANTLAFMAMGVNYALLLGVGVGLSVVIPYVGAVIIAVPVILVAIFQFGFSSDLMWVLVIYTVIQLLDSNVLTPMLFAKAMSLDAFSILAAIMIFGGLWGFWGVFFAIPLATFIKSLITRWPNADLPPTTAPTTAPPHGAAVSAAKPPQTKAPAPTSAPKQRV